jgi:hypothetical protein
MVKSFRAFTENDPAPGRNVVKNRRCRGRTVSMQIVKRPTPSTQARKTPFALPSLAFPANGSRRNLSLELLPQRAAFCAMQGSTQNNNPRRDPFG